ncbi:MAG TPA: oligopeptide ABC transporter permease [Bacillus sp. (in: firmicutes)]|uniref:oligopeptide ABC transporter permease n=1 Tax=Bacillus litorisediminis TaxID=2922713 RepID=UPI001FAFEF56|nr:oligopeptide ABC transporter permease [Bacillus litorisediminis]HWO77503.1 oligopeptide ABC transporter permease [Bacillus sp. (in: firmicutes)]
MKLNEEQLPKSLFEPVEVNQNEREVIAKPSLTFMQDAWRRLKKNKGAVVSLFLLLFFIVMAFVGPYLNEYSLEDQDTNRANLPPKIPVLENIEWLPFDGKVERYGEDVDLYAEQGIEEYFWFGTDSLGRDIFTRVWEGTKISLYIAFLAAFIDMVIGVAYGGISAYYGGKVDQVMQRIIEVLVGIPLLIVVVLMILIMKPGILSITIALTITGWTGMARVVRGQVLKLKNQEYVLASKTLGASNKRIISKHLLPNLAGVIIINTMFTIPNAIFFEAFLSFIGLGLQSPYASLGTLIEDGYQAMQIFPHVLIFPAVILSIIMICFNLLADGLRDAFDPKMRD